MKALPSIAFNEFRGTAKEVTARKVKGRTVLNGRAQHSRKKTPKQALRRANFAFITRQYKTLTAEQMKAWEQLAAQHREKALIGDGEPLTAHNLFVCLNANRAAVGVPLTKEAPENIHGSSYIKYDDIFITPTSLLITGLSDPATPTTKLVVKIASSSSNGVTKAWDRTVIVGESYVPDWGDVDLTEIYLKQFGVPIIVGHSYFLEMYWIDENSGYVSEISRAATVATENQSIKGVDYMPRSRVTMNDLNDTGGMVSLDMEASEGSVIMSIDAVCIDSPGGSNISFTTKEPVSDIIRHSMGSCFGRCYEGNKSYMIAQFAIWTDNYKGASKITIAHRAGVQYDHKIELFSSAPCTPR